MLHHAALSLELSQIRADRACSEYQVSRPDALIHRRVAGPREIIQRADRDETMLEPDFDPVPTAVRVHRCGNVSPCRARRCQKLATLIAEKVDAAGLHLRQIELRPLQCQIVIERERNRGLDICDRRDQ